MNVGKTSSALTEERREAAVKGSEYREDASIALARYTAKLNYDDIPRQVTEATKIAVMNALHAALAGSSAPGVAEFVELVKDWGGKAESSIIAFGGKVPSVNAGMLNGGMINARDYEDTLDAANMHAEAPVLSAAFAIAESKGKVSGRDFIVAVTLGIDVACRLGLALAPSSRRWLGFQRTALIGYFGAVVTAGKLLGLDEQKLVNAIGLAFSQASGTKQFAEDGAMKWLQLAFASRGGILAAFMSQRGLIGCTNSLEGKHGLFTSFLRGDYYPQELTTGLGTKFEVTNLSFKPYPCCRATHTYIDGALGLVKEHDIQPGDIEEIRVFIGEEPHNQVHPLERKRNPQTVVDAEFSVPFLVSLAATRRKVTVGNITLDSIRDPAIHRLMAKVVPQFDPELAKVRRGIPPSVVQITAKDVVYTKRVEFPYGSPQNPMSIEDHARQLRDSAHYAIRPIPEENIEKALNLLRKLEEIDNVASLLHLVV